MPKARAVLSISAKLEPAWRRFLRAALSRLGLSLSGGTGSATITVEEIREPERPERRVECGPNPNPPGSRVLCCEPVWTGHEVKLAVVGESYRQDVLRQLAGDDLAAGTFVKFTALIVPEPTNPHDPNAIAVHANGYGQIGFFSRADAIRYRPAAQELLRRGAIGECKGWLIGGDPSRPTIGAQILISPPNLLAKALRPRTRARQSKHP
jgi:hypothetical protein